MSSKVNNHAIGYHGDVLPALPPLMSVRTMNDMTCMSKALQIFDINPNLADGDSIAKHSRVYFDRFGELCESDVDEGVNGQVTTLEARMSTDYVEACQDLDFQIKYNREHAIRLGMKWDKISTHTENGVALWMNRRVTAFSYIKAAGSAHPSNVVRNPLAVDGVWTVPSTRVASAPGETQLSEIIKKMAIALANHGLECEPMMTHALVPQEGYSNLGTGQEQLNQCCGEQNYLVSGTVSHSTGFSIVRDIYAPKAFVDAQGPVYYVMLIPHKQMWLPIDIHYIEWEKHLQDVYFYGSGTFGFKAPDPRRIAVAMVRFI